MSKQITEPFNLIKPEQIICGKCGESRISYIEAKPVINSRDCTVYEVFCNVCAKTMLVEVLSERAKRKMSQLDVEAGGHSIHSKNDDEARADYMLDRITKVRSALRDELIDRVMIGRLDRKKISSGDNE